MRNITKIIFILSLCATGHATANNRACAKERCKPRKMNTNPCKPYCGIRGSFIGDTAHQKQYSKNYGYNSTTLGGVYGVEGYGGDGSSAGIAFANTNSSLHEDTQLRAVRLFGYHIMLYGNTKFASDSYFMEWMLSGLTNKNKISQLLAPNSQIYGATTSYRTSQGLARINLGQSTENDCWKFTLVEHLSGGLLYQENYLTHNSSAARNYTPRRWSNVLTVGGGIRMETTPKNYWLKGTGALRVMGMYDVVRTIQETTANFINGLENFTLSSAPARWAFQAGLNYTVLCVGCVNLTFSYDFELRTKYTNNAAAIKLSLFF